MITGIADIIQMLIKSECTPEQAQIWINGHIDLAVGDANLKDLRDMFAAKAMQGMLSGGCNWHEFYSPEDPYTATAYKIADAMLEARVNQED